MILFVSNRLQFQKMARYAALNCGEFYVTEKWRAGCFSNRHEVC
jgi:ribosomal protein S2